MDGEGFFRHDGLKEHFIWGKHEKTDAFSHHCLSGGAAPGGFLRGRGVPVTQPDPDGDRIADPHRNGNRLTDGFTHQDSNGYRIAKSHGGCGAGHYPRYRRA